MSWKDQITKLQLDLERRLVSQRQFSDGITELIRHAGSPLDALEFQVERQSPFSTVSLGTASAVDPTEVRKFDLVGGTCRLRLWRKEAASPSSSPPVLYGDDLQQLMLSYWKGNLRDSKSWIISAQNAERENLIQNTLSDLYQARGELAFFFCDLDHFGAADKALGHLEGDRIIREFAAILDAQVEPYGIAIHRSGDEFILIYPSGDACSAIELAHRFMVAASEYDFKSGETQLGVKVGIALLDAENRDVSYGSLEAQAEKATSDKNGQPQRGRARLHIKADAQIFPADDYQRELAVCVVRSNLGFKSPFVNPWLSLISNVVFQTCVKGDVLKISPAARQVLEWIQPEFAPSLVTITMDGHQAVPMSPVFSFLDVGLAVAHGYMRYALRREEYVGKSLDLHYGDTGVKLEEGPDSVEIFSFGDLNQGRKCSLGKFWTFKGGTEENDRVSSRVAILLNIGHMALPFPRSLFDEVITVDDRPTRGGGLPDFWEATIARLVGAAMSNPNLRALFVYGKHEFAQKTVESLRAITGWKQKAKEIAYKTGMDLEGIERTTEMFSGAVFFSENAPTLISDLSAVLSAEVELQPLSKRPLRGSARFLSRNLDAKAVMLQQQDGCRVRTIAEAYPTVLELARRPDSETLIRDQAGQELRELIDFKVVLTAPGQEMVPAFYADESGSLEDYYRRVFGSSTGLFGGPLRESGQFEAVMSHLVSSISGSQSYSTRRAILVVPHVISHGQDLTPLGLVSIRVIPRIATHRTLIHFSYTWRTVEALVGFPYSLFASVRFSQYILEALKGQLTGNLTRTIEMGHVSYVAHSLHVFLDEYGQNIARRIVNDASD